MSSHIVNNEFQSDKYPSCPPGKIPLSVKDPLAQDLLWEYSRRYLDCGKDSEFAFDLRACLIAAGFKPKHLHIGDIVEHVQMQTGNRFVVIDFLRDGSGDFYAVDEKDRIHHGPFKQADYEIVVRAVP
jgi:hypothetical protein